MTNRRKCIVLVVLISVVLLAALGLGGALYFKAFIAELYTPVPVPPAGDSKQTVLCLGDSITHGNVSANYVDELMLNFAGESLRFVNGGINGDMVHDVSDRLDELLAMVGTPDIVTLLIGTNDANAALDPEVGQRALDHPDVGRIPDADYYRTSIEHLIERIASETDAEIILISIPPIGERPGSIAWEQSLEFVTVDRAAASATGIQYVAFGENLISLILAADTDIDQLPFHEDWNSGMVKGIIDRHFRGMDYNSIGDKSGYLYHSDQLHLNERGASILTGMLEPVIRLALDGE